MKRISMSIYLLMCFAAALCADTDKELIAAAGAGDFNGVKRCIAQGADVNTLNHRQETALMWAALRGRQEIVALLLHKKAGVNAKNHIGDTALMWAAAEGHSRIVELLLQAGAEVNTANDFDYTPLMLAVISGSRDAAALLVSSGAVIDTKNKNQDKVLWSQNTT